jgi:hypothetical protein
LSRIIVPGSADVSSYRRLLAGPTTSASRSRPSGSFPDGGRTVPAVEGSLQNLADHTNGTTAASTAKMIGYPTTDLDILLPVIMLPAGVALCDVHDPAPLHWPAARTTGGPEPLTHPALRNIS